MKEDHFQNSIIDCRMIAICTLSLLFTVVYICRCFHASFWFDEAYGIVNYARVPFSQIIPNTVREMTMPPLFYFVLKISTVVFGQTAFAYHIAAFIPFLILFIWNIIHIRKKYGYPLAFGVALILGVGMPFYKYATEVRSYSWSMMFVILCAYSAYCMVEKESVDFKNGALFSFCGVLGAYSHYFAFAAICFIYLVTYIWAIRIDRNKGIRFVLCSAGFSLLLYLPWLGTMIYSVRGVAGALAESEIYFPDFIMALRDPFGKWGILLWGAYAVFAYFAYKEKRRADVFLFIAAMSSFWGVYLTGGLYDLISHSSSFKDKYLIPSTGLILFSFVILVINYHGRRHLALIMGIIACGLFLPHYHDIITGEIVNHRAVKEAKEALRAYPPENTAIITDGSETYDVMCRLDLEAYNCYTQDEAVQSDHIGGKTTFLLLNPDEEMIRDMKAEYWKTLFLMERQTEIYISSNR